MRSQPAFYSGELAFLNELRSGHSGLYRTAPWLLSDFSAPIWDIKFSPSESVRKIDFGIAMSNGALLTEPANAEILRTFKHWLCVQTHPHANSSRRLSSRTARNRIHRTLHIIDYLLLNQREIGLTDVGVGGLTSNTFFGLVSATASCNDIAEGIYGWSTRLTEFLRELGSSMSSSEIQLAVSKVPELSMDLIGDGPLGLSSTELLAARVGLFKSGYYRSRIQNPRSDVLITLNTVTLARRLYKNTLWGAQRRACPMELQIEGQDRVFREMHRVPVAEYDDERASEKLVSLYLTCTLNLSLVERTGVDVPRAALNSLSEREASSWLDVKDIGRFQLPPQDVVLTSMRAALEFPLKYGDALIDLYLTISERAVRLGQSFASTAASSEFDQMLSLELRALGVKSWKSNGAATDYFDRLRRSESFIDLMTILVGSVAVAVGAVMARRQGELVDLDALTCLDESARNLVFMNRKSGESDYRQREARPIPPVVAGLIQMLQRLLRGLINLGLIPASGPLFQYPHRRTGLMISSPSGACRCVDRFCDYIMLPGREEGTRYYLRQHQFRRFFAVAFFWGSGFGGLDTLRWFLGQSDPSQVWRYVLESVPGKILMAVQSRYAIQKLLEEDPAAERLADLLESKFGTRNFSVLSTSELTSYVESLLESDQVSVEPHFVHGDNGTRYQILVVVRNLTT